MSTRPSFSFLSFLHLFLILSVSDETNVVDSVVSDGGSRRNLIGYISRQSYQTLLPLAAVLRRGGYLLEKEKPRFLVCHLRSSGDDEREIECCRGLDEQCLVSERVERIRCESFMTHRPRFASAV
ncbi:hypothetical protein F2P81_022930 [Scophthalmus maximus]|uniref:Uncharacterized protein n=1 Tax=Scophthalmus maximus TaxID=52904 RepID=A0A6A4RVX9_SCOMX|nr:hypothetical protein F2P81_022930 [Scophthalmus maximus]